MSQQSGNTPDSYSEGPSFKVGRSLDIQPKILCSSPVCARQPQITLPPFIISYFPNLYTFIFLPGDTVYSGLLSASLDKSQINEILRRCNRNLFPP